MGGYDMQIIARKYQNRFWLESVLSLSITPFSIIVMSIIAIIYAKESVIVKVVAYFVIILVIVYSVLKLFYVLKPKDILTLEKDLLSYHQSRKKVHFIKLADIISISSNRIRHKANYHYGTLIIKTTSTLYKIPWVSDLEEVERKLNIFKSN